MQINYISDPHVHGRLFQSKIAALDEILSSEADIHVITGDLLHNSRLGDGDVNQFAMVKGLNDVLRRNKPVILLEGNHDQFGSRGSALDFFHLPNLTKVAGEPQYFGFEDTEMICVPWIRNRSDWKQLVLDFLNSRPGTKKHRIIAAHMNVKDSFQNKNFRVNPDDHFVFSIEELKATAFAPTDLICGHLHTRQVFQGIKGGYVGALSQNNFGEEYNPAGYLRWKDGKYVYRALDMPEFHNTTEEEFLKLTVDPLYDYYKFTTANPEKYSGFANLVCVDPESAEITGTASAFDGRIELSQLIEDYCKATNQEIPQIPFLLNELEKISLSIVRSQTGLDSIDYIRLCDVGPSKKEIIHKNTIMEFEPGLNAITGKNGTGKAQPLTEPVLTPGGWKAMGSLRVGSRVYDGKGNLTRVTGTYYQGFKEVYEVSFSDGSSTRCCAEHLWVYRKSGKAQPWCVGEARNFIAYGDELINKHLHIPLCGHIKHVHKDVPLDPYVVGALIGDGSMKFRTGVNFTSADDFLIDKVASLLPKECCFSRPTRRAGSAAVSLQIINPNNQKSKNNKQPNATLDALRTLGLQGKGSRDKFLPEIYKFISKDQRLALLQGLMDTDGYVNKSGNGVDLCTASHRLALDVVDLVRSLGGVAKIGETHKKAQGWTEPKLYYLVHIKTNFCPFTLPRKVSRWKPLSKYPPARRFVKASLVGRERCMCISVSSSEKTYITKDYIVTHNTLAIESVLASLYGSYVDRGALKNYCHGHIITGLITAGKEYHIENRPNPKGGLVAYFDGVECKLKGALATEVVPRFGDSNVFESVVFMDQGSKKDLVEAGEAKRLEILSKLLNLEILEEHRKVYAKQAKDEKAKFDRFRMLTERQEEKQAAVDRLTLALTPLQQPDTFEINRLEKFLDERRQNAALFDRYEKWLEIKKWLERNPGAHHEHISTLRNRKERCYVLQADIARMEAVLSQKGIGCGPNFLPCSLLKSARPDELAALKEVLASKKLDEDEHATLASQDEVERQTAQLHHKKEAAFDQMPEKVDSVESVDLQLKALKADRDLYLSVRRELDLAQEGLRKVQEELSGLEGLEEAVRGYDFLESLCSKKGLPLYVISSIVVGLQKQLDEITTMAELDLKIKISLSKEEGSEVSDAFDILYSRKGRSYAKVKFSSGGERTMIRVLFKLALMLYLNKYFGNYKVLIMDEPEKGLDADNLNTLLVLLSKLKGRLNQVIVITHNQQIESIADNVIRL